MTSLLALADRLDKLASRLKHDANATKVKVAEAIVTDLIINTPVDSSKALSNWQVRLGRAVSRSIEPYFYGEQGSTQETSGAAALAAAKAVLRNVKPGQTIWISNVLPYIQRLNDGYSSQAPAGYVERSVVIGRAVVKTVRIVGNK